MITSQHREAAWYKAEQRAVREEQWLKDNEPTFLLFCNFTLEAVRAAQLRGETPRIGAKAVAERIRWARITRTKRDSQGYIVNNSYITAMAREFVRIYPHLKDIFEFRK
jgi:hypothetical protein